MGYRIVEWAKQCQKGVNRLYGYYFTRPVQRYNIENRAYKLLDKIESEEVKPKAAPHEPITEQILRRIEKEHPEVMEEIKSKPDKLVANINQVRITSTDTLIEPERRQKAKLPIRTNSVKLPHFGISEPKNVAPGKITLSAVVELIEGRGMDPEEWTDKAIADKYNIDEKNVSALVEHFKPFFKHTPPEPRPWYSREKLEFLAAGKITNETWTQYRAEDMQRIEEADRQALEQKLSRTKKHKLITGGHDGIISKSEDSK